MVWAIVALTGWTLAVGWLIAFVRAPCDGMIGCPTNLPNVMTWHRSGRSSDGRSSPATCSSSWRPSRLDALSIFTTGRPDVSAAPPDERRQRLREGMRAEFIAGADEECRRRTGRPTTAEELERVLRRYLGDA